MLENTKTKYRTILLLLLLNAIASGLTILFAYFSKNIIDKVFIERDTQYLYFITKILIISCLIYFILELLNLYYTANWKINLEFNVKKSFFKSIQNIIFRDLDNISDTSLYHRLFSDGGEISQYFYTLCIVIPFNLLFVVVIFCFMFSWSKILTIYSLILILIEFMNIYIAKKPILKISEDQKKVDQNLVNFVSEKIQMIFFSQIMNLRDKTTNDVSEKFDESKLYTMKNYYYISIFGEISSLIRQIWFIGLFIVGANLIIKSKITIGIFVGFQALLGYMIEPFSVLVNSLICYQNNKVCFQRFIEYYELPKIDDSSLLPFNFKELIDIKNISFAYQGYKNIIDKLDEKIYKGDFVVISGTSGSGKTTLMNLFLRQNKPTQGTICIDSVDINRINYKDYMEKVSFVLQKPVILNDSLKNNIALYRDVKNEEITDLLKKLNLSKLFSELDNNLNSYIYNRKEKLSVGEAQRINIARILLKNSELIYLDEPTSSLDVKSEKMVLKLLLEHCKRNNVTMIINSHSREVAKYADRIIQIRRESSY